MHTSKHTYCHVSVYLSVRFSLCQQHTVNNDWVNDPIVSFTVTMTILLVSQALHRRPLSFLLTGCMVYVVATIWMTAQFMLMWCTSLLAVEWLSKYVVYVVTTVLMALSVCGFVVYVVATIWGTLLVCVYVITIIQVVSSVCGVCGCMWLLPY